MAKQIKDQSNASDDAALPKRDRAAGRAAIEAQRKREEQVGWSVTQRTGAARDGHPDGWQTGGR